MTGLTLDQAVAQITGTDPRFLVQNATINGVSYRVFGNAPASIPELLLSSVSAHGDASADFLVFEGERWSIEEFMRDVRVLASSLQKYHGVGKGRRVALAMRNCPEMLIAFMAIATLGGVTTFLNAWWTSEELDYALEDTGATLVLADGLRAERLSALHDTREFHVIGVRDGEGQAAQSYSELMRLGDEAALDMPQIAPEDDFAIMYSSGTTSHPKGVVQTHRGAVNAVYTWMMQIEMGPLLTPPDPQAAPDPRPAVLIVTPLFHVTASHACFLLAVALGAKVVLTGKWDADLAAELIEREQITRLLGVPTQTSDLLDASLRLGKSLESLRYLGSGGAKRPPSQVADLATRFPDADIATGWGMTETNAIGIGMTGEDYTARPGSAGRLYPPLQDIRFLDDAGQDMPLGDIGEITVKSPCNMREYLNKPRETAEVLDQGWLRTGDLGWIDAEGFVTIVDRKKNIIIRGGENIACLDVEAALHSHPDVMEACAFPVPNDRLGEVVGAAVRVRDGSGVSPEDLKDHLGARIARFKVPDHFWLQTSPLARGATAKIDRRAIRDDCLQRLASAAPLA